MSLTIGIDSLCPCDSHGVYDWGYCVKSPIDYPLLDEARNGAGTKLKQLIDQHYPLDPVLAERAKRYWYWFNVDTSPLGCILVLLTCTLSDCVIRSLKGTGVTDYDRKQIEDTAVQKLLDTGLRPSDMTVVDLENGKTVFLTIQSKNTGPVDPIKLAQVHDLKKREENAKQNATNSYIMSAQYAAHGMYGLGDSHLSAGRAENGKELELLRKRMALECSMAAEEAEFVNAQSSSLDEEMHQSQEHKNEMEKEIQSHNGTSTCDEPKGEMSKDNNSEAQAKAASQKSQSPAPPTIVQTTRTTKCTTMPDPKKSQSTATSTVVQTKRTTKCTTVPAPKKSHPPAPPTTARTKRTTKCTTMPEKETSLPSNDPKPATPTPVTSAPEVPTTAAPTLPAQKSGNDHFDDAWLRI